MTQLPWVTGNWETRWLVSVIATQTLLLSAGQNDVTRAMAVLLHFVSSLQQHPSAVLPLTALTTSSTSPTICKALNCKRRQPMFFVFPSFEAATRSACLEGANLCPNLSKLCCGFRATLGRAQRFPGRFAMWHAKCIQVYPNANVVSL